MRDATGTAADVQDRRAVPCEAPVDRLALLREQRRVLYPVGVQADGVVCRE